MFLISMDHLLSSLIIGISDALGPTLFVCFSVALSIFLCFFAIPKSSEMMVNNAAGLSGRWLGPKSRALVINASTNNPEAFSMTVSMGMGRMGGWANPLGSLLANCYLMYLFGLLYVMAKLAFTGRKSELAKLIRLLKREKRLILWHVSMAVGLYGAGIFVLSLMTNGLGESSSPPPGDAPQGYPHVGFPIFLSIAVILLGVVVFVLWDRRMKRNRPELFTDICDDSHSDSLAQFLLGTVALIATCWVMNEMFLAWVELYRGPLEGVFGLAVFAKLHYFLGALITSLPELRVATENYARITSPDLNTALGSASYSNLVNLVIALIGLLVFLGLSLSGTILPW